ncbi:ABC transporter permease [Geminisphaera colitermitum]|uniref:ABC transporter permease n=1 Tax=Geminisphaera colitermitum TaxID=1148786 RepID=UPI000693EF38|nr:ABC transporter permease subunit [Geminisphaera colitermitum]
MNSVPFSPARLGLIASNTFLEAVRQKLFNFLLLLAIGLVASALFFRDFNFGSSELKFIADFGFGALVFFGSVLTVATTAQLFFSEIENRTALTLLAKPIWRTEFVFGKFLGVLAVVGIFCAVTIGLMIGILLFREHAILKTLDPENLPPGGLINYTDILIVGALQWIKFGVLTAIVLLIASFSNTNLYTVVTGFFVLVICHLQYLARDAYGNVANFFLREGVRLLSYIFPNFQLFNLADQVGQGIGIDLAVAARVAGYGFIYILVIGLLAVYSFRSREI